MVPLVLENFLSSWWLYWFPNFLFVISCLLCRSCSNGPQLLLSGRTVLNIRVHSMNFWEGANSCPPLLPSWPRIPTLFLWKAVLVTLNPLHFCMDFRISLSISIKSLLNFYWDCIELQINWQRTDILILSNLLKHGIIFHFSQKNFLVFNVWVFYSVV